MVTGERLVGTLLSDAIHSWYSGNPVIFDDVNVSDLMERVGVNHAEAPAVSVPLPVSLLVPFHIGLSVCAPPQPEALGEFAVGTNDQIRRFTKNILFDEKIGGTLHVAVGAGYPETGSRNHSSVHWDFICDMRHDSEIWVDGELFYKNGKVSEQIIG